MKISHAESQRKYAAKNALKELARHLRWAKKNPDKVKQIDARWRIKNASILKIKIRSYNKSARERIKKWQEANPLKVLASRSANNAKRRCAGRIPKWGNPFFIKEIYSLAQLRTKMTGIRWEVDHIVPLVNPTVCGLHVENNLQVIPAIMNHRKHNSFLDGDTDA